jgi:hypothetical protein
MVVLKKKKSSGCQGGGGVQTLCMGEIGYQTCYVFNFGGIGGLGSGNLCGGGDCFGGGGSPQTPPLQTCQGSAQGGARGIGNTGALVGNQGAINGVTVQLGDAAVIPSQFGLPDNGAAIAPYAADISGETFGLNGPVSFSRVGDVIGGTSPFPGMNVRDFYQQRYPGMLDVEIYGGPDQGTNAALVTITVPQSLGCPVGTEPAVGDPVLPTSGSPIPAVAVRIR